MTDPAPIEVDMFDAHCHLDAMAYRGDRVPDAEFVAEVMTAARAAGVTRVITVGDSVAGNMGSHAG